MPYLTPDDIPEGDDCRPLVIPASGEWLALFGGALTELTKTYNWQQFGALTVDETVAKMQAIIANWYEAECGEDCELPGGGKIIRLNSVGVIQELVGGEWVEPTEDYELPPTLPREEETPEDRLCAASENAAAVLQLFYENVSDSFNDSLDTAAAIAALGSVVGIALGSTGFGLAATALIEIAQLIFGVFYSIMEFITADLWTEDFNDQFLCLLLNCASEDADVVMFDYNCLLLQLADATSLTLDFEEVRLYGQIAYLLQFIGAQGLDAAGATTAVEDPDCAFCGAHCHFFDFTETDGDFIPGYPDFAPPAAYVSDWVNGEGWSPSGSPAIYNGFYIDFDPIDVSQITAHWAGGDESMGACGNISMELYLGGIQQAVVSTDQSWQTTGNLQIVGAYTCDRIIVSGNNCPNTGWSFDNLTVSYAGDPVFGADNCP